VSPDSSAPMTPAFTDLPPSWAAQLGDELAKPYFRELERYVAAQRAEHPVYPSPEQVFAAFERTPFEQVRVLLLGQDPYHQRAGQAHGLCFSVPPGVKLPPSLRNVYAELAADLGVPTPEHGCLTAWAERGVLLLNTVLTVRAKTAHSHAKQGWETFTDRVIEVLAARPEPLVFMLWGKPAQQKRALIEAGADRGGRDHVILAAPHPSPYSAHTGFFGSRPFSQANAALQRWGLPPIDWSLAAASGPEGPGPVGRAVEMD
jgi:uracil-DNA glycosylase